MSSFSGERVDVVCVECGALMVLHQKSRHGPFYGCSEYPRCHCTHGAHPDGSPLGVPADRETRESRQLAHAVFETYFALAMYEDKEDHRKARGKAYRHLGDLLSIAPDECHIAKFNKATCRAVIATYRDIWRRENA